MQFRDYADGKVHSIEGMFPLSDPWWSATLFVSGGQKKRLVGCRSFKLRSDERVVRERVVWLFMTACTSSRKNDCVCQEETGAFHKALRWVSHCLIFILKYFNTIFIF